MDIATYLLISNSKLALRFLIRLCERLQILDRLSLRNRKAELHIALGVFVSRLLEVISCMYFDTKEEGQHT
jgi:hypothetical protein